MKRRNFLQGLLALTTIPLIAKAKTEPGVTVIQSPETSTITLPPAPEGLSFTIKANETVTVVSNGDQWTKAHREVLGRKKKNPLLFNRINTKSIG